MGPIWVRILTSPSAWSLGIVSPLLLVSLILSAVLSLKVPSSAAADQQALKCARENFDGAGNLQGCLALWCSNTAHWQRAWCDGNGTFPYDPQYNLVALADNFPYDQASANLAWTALGLLLSAAAVEVVIVLLEHLETGTMSSFNELTKRFRVASGAITSCFWSLCVAASAILLAGAIKTSQPFGLYNSPSGLWTAASIVVAVMILLHFLKRGLRIHHARYKKHGTGGGKAQTAAQEPCSQPDASISQSSAECPSNPTAVSSMTTASQRRSSSMGNGSRGAREFSWEEIVEATSAFIPENLIGQGGFGKVYRGLLNNQAVAAKVLYSATSDLIPEDFKAELEVIGRVHHRNLVQLIGYCLTEEKAVLILEYMDNGSLDDHLKDLRRSALTWTSRLHIAICAARGISYLHSDCTPKVIHRDIKASNILLDVRFNAKVADFGLARYLAEGNDHITTRVMGTIGYLAPDYAFSGKLTDKSDVYSFGVILLELLTGRKPIAFGADPEHQSLVEWAWGVDSGAEDPLLFMDPLLHGDFSSVEAFSMWTIALSCVDPVARNRPDMQQVLHRLLECATRTVKPTQAPRLFPVPEAVSDQEEVSEQHTSAGALSSSGSESSHPHQSLGSIFHDLMSKSGKGDGEGDAEGETGIDVHSAEYETSEEYSAQSFAAPPSVPKNPLDEIEAQHNSSEYWNAQLQDLKRYGKGQ